MKMNVLYDVYMIRHLCALASFHYFCVHCSVFFLLFSVPCVISNVFKIQMLTSSLFSVKTNYV